MILSHRLQEILGEASSVCVLTGAGISAESGIATFRGAGGIWQKLKPEELANVDAFMRNPQRVWEWYQYRRTIVHEVSPNPGHEALAQMEGLFPDFTLVTQNVDGLHQRAGSRNVHELHGNIERSFCISCRTFDNDVRVTKEVAVPKCRLCGGLMRPDVVWFGEMLPQEQIEAAEESAHRCNIFFSIGTSAVVYPAAGLPLTARANGAYLVEVNTDETEISHRADEVLRGTSGTVLPEVLRVVRDRRGVSS